MIRFSAKDVRPLGRASRGVRAITLGGGDYVVGMGIARDDAKILVVSENGYGKRTEISEYKVQTRGGKGTTTYKISEQTGMVAGFDVVTSDDDLILITSEGVVIRLSTDEISVLSRVTKGVRLMRLAEDVKIVSMARINRSWEEKENAQADGENAEENAENAETVE